MRSEGRSACPIPAAAGATGWSLVESGFDPIREREVESRFTVANGWLGVRGALIVRAPSSAPATYVAGVFARPGAPSSVPELFVLPDWAGVKLAVADHELSFESGEIVELLRVLDVREATFSMHWRHRAPSGRIVCVEERRFASLADRHLLVQSIVLTAENFSGRIRVESAIERAPTIRVPGTNVTVALALTTVFQGRELGGGEELEIEVGVPCRLDRLAVVATSAETKDPAGAAAERLRRVVGRDRTELVSEHVEAWAARWGSSDIEIDGPDSDRRALRFAEYHLLSAASGVVGVSIGARGLTGDAYKGHVFWDAELFVLPFFTFTAPSVARGLLSYRYRLLPAARARAAEHGYRGALYPWESADDGSDVTPPFTLAPGAEVIPVLSGEHEVHISADVAHAAWTYWQATGDDEFLLVEGAEILLETARFWASRGVTAADGRFHILNVIGPDEYHEAVDDNAYTNGMARWNLERGAEVAELLARRWPERWRALAERLTLAPDEPSHWLELARCTYTGFDPRTELIEQFRGFFALDEVELVPYRERTTAMDLVLGREKTARSKVIKQADTLMLIHLLWDRFPPRVREANYRYYERRTSHGSSLSPPIHALLAARLGHVEAAERYFRQTGEIDLENTMGNAAGGVHIAALGGLWQAAVFGIAGVALRAGGFALAPELPPSWTALRFPIMWHGQRVRISISREPAMVEVELERGEGIELALGDEPPFAMRGASRWRARRGSRGWEPWEQE